jgi:hypothetical protein
LGESQKWIPKKTSLSEFPLKNSYEFPLIPYEILMKSLWNPSRQRPVSSSARMNFPLISTLTSPLAMTSMTRLSDSLGSDLRSIHRY